MTSFLAHGNLLVMHAGGPTAVLNASLYGVIREAMRHSQVEGIYGARFGTEGLLEGNFLDLRREAATTIEALAHTPGSILGSSRRSLQAGDDERSLEHLRARNIRFLFVNGGNSSMRAASQLARLANEQGHEMRVIGIPTAADNHLVRTDHSPGYGSAARYLAVSALDLGRDNEALPSPVLILETTGATTGWLAAAAALAARSPEDGPQLVYVPEIPFAGEQFLQDVERTYRRLGRVLAVVAEGIKPEGIKNERGQPAFSSAEESNQVSFGPSGPGNVLLHLAQWVGRELGLPVDTEKSGRLARASLAHVSPVDRAEAQQCGEIAVRHALLGITGMMVTLERVSDAPYRCEFGLAPLEEIGQRERALPREFINEEGNYPSQRFRDYAGPLVGPSLPEYARLQGNAVRAGRP